MESTISNESLAKEKSKCSIKKIPINIIKKAYNQTKSIYKAAKIIGCSPQGLHKRLKISGIKTSQDGKWLKEDMENLKDLCVNSPHLSYKEMGNILGRSKNSIEIKAVRLGFNKMKNRQPLSQLNTRRRQEISRWKSQKLREEQSFKFKKWIAENGHPRGMLGKKHSQKTKNIISQKGKGRTMSMESILKTQKTKMEKYGTLANNISRQKCTWKAGWRNIEGRDIYFRSRWEANYARYLELLKKCGEIKSWEFESDIFWFEGVKRGCVSYKPDFKIYNKNDSIEYHEIKGWMDAKSKTKIRRMAKYHPDIRLIIISSDWFKENEKKLSAVCRGWEIRQRSIF